jgi:hypothetical protein
LRFLHRKAHVDDDWSRNGAPSVLWDRRSTPPMMAFPRFDLLDSSYAVTLMADARAECERDAVDVCRNE